MKGKVVYLLGAGAMIDLGAPTTNDLTNDIKTIVQKCCIKKIIKSLDDTYGCDNYNFETIIAGVEYLLDWTKANESIGKTVSSTNIIASVFKPCYANIIKGNVCSYEIRDLYNELINYIIDKISEYDYCKKDDNQLLLKTYLMNHKIENKLKIYSLNYDRLIPKLVPSINEGTYILGVGNDDKFFSYDIKPFVNHSFTYTSLHGSIYLKIKENAPYNIIQASLPERLTNSSFIKGGSPNDVKIFSPIIAGYSKSQRVLSEPFSFGFSTFMSDCDNCNKLIIVGYSFSDPHINSILKKLIFDKDKIVDIIDYDQEGYYKNVEKYLTSQISCMANFDQTSYGAMSQNGKIRIFMNGFIEYIKMNLIA